MKILYFSKSYTTHDRRFLAALADTGHEIHYLQLNDPDNVTERFRFEERPLPAGIQVVNWNRGRRKTGYYGWLKLFRYLELRRNLNEILEHIQPDLVQAGPIQTCAFLTALTGFHPLVSTSWGSDLLVDADRNPIQKWITTYTLRNSDVLVGDCQPVRKKAISFGMRNEDIVTFPWGIDLQTFTPMGSTPANASSAAATSNGVSSVATSVFTTSIVNGKKESTVKATTPNPFVLLSNRSWEPVYGVDMILRAFNKAVKHAVDDSKDGSKLKLVLLGNGSQASQVHQFIQKENLGDKVDLPGRVSQKLLPGVYRSADLYISASRSDGTSISLLEAMACGLPVLVSNIPGNREWITPGVEGWLFPDGDEDALANSILQVIKTPGLDKMGKAGRLKVESLADWTQNFPKLLDAYQLAMNHYSDKRQNIN